MLAAPHAERAAEPDYEKIMSGFRTPPSTARPYVRWWWNGDKLDRQEVLRQLDVLNAAGIGGVEINPIRFPAPRDELNIPSLDWLSTEWCEMVAIAARGARDRGMEADIIVGSGWPFGGRFLPREHQTKMLSVVRKRVAGPKEVVVTRQEVLDSSRLALHSKNDDVFKVIELVRITPARVSSFTPGEDLTPQFVDGVLTATVPEGEHILHFFVVQEGFQAVINGAPGSDGPVLNHFSRESTEYYLQHMSEGMAPTLGKLGDQFRAFFCDSLELEGANWCDDFLAEFERRRKYDVTPWLPYLLSRTGHMGNPIASKDSIDVSPEVRGLVQRVRYDYWTTLIELFRERFLGPFNQWCRAQGGKSRVQAYGRNYEPLESSMLVDIPECETWLYGDAGRNAPRGAYSMNNKFTSSGARLAGRRVVSCEEITNTDHVFFAPLEMIKIVGDESNLSGVTHSILHGFNYSPREAGFPGWVRYGTYFSEQNTWWPYVRRWTDYKARLSWLLQRSDPQANIAILHPLADLWKVDGMQRDPFPSTRRPSYAHDLWRAIHQRGFNCDYTSEGVICRSEMVGGAARFGPRSYDTIVLMEVDTIRQETAQALEKFASCGGSIVFIGRAPTLAAGLRALGVGDGVVSEAMRRILRNYGGRCRVVPTPPTGGDLASWFGEVSEASGLKPDVRFETHSRFLTQTYHRLAGRDMYFLVNSSRDQAVSTIATFNTSGRTPWVWDPETGERQVHRWLDSSTQLLVELGPAESRVLVFEDSPRDNPGREAKPSQDDAYGIDGEWRVELEHVDGTSQSIQVAALGDLGDIEGLAGFAGRATYKADIVVPEVPTWRFLDLGIVRDVSEVSIGEHALGVRWYGRHVYALPASLSEGRHELCVTVTTILGNYCKSLRDNAVAQGWTSRTNRTPMGLIGPARLLRGESLVP